MVKRDRQFGEATCEATECPSMRFVSPKSSEKLTLQAEHRIRQRPVSDRTRLVNQTRGLMAEHGIVIVGDISRLRHALVQIVEGSEPGLNELLQDLARDMKTERTERDTRLAVDNRRIRDLFRQDPRRQWTGRMREWRYPNVVALDLANKNPRIIRSLLSRGDDHNPARAASPA